MKQEYSNAYNCLTIYCNSKDTAIIDELPIEMVARYDRRGRKYVWLYPSQKKVDELIYKFGSEQIADGVIRLESGGYKEVNCLWLNM